MYSKAKDIDGYQVVVTFDKEKSPLRVSLTSKEAVPAFGSMAYGIPSSGPSVPVTILRDNEIFNEGAKELATALAKKFQRPVFVTSSVNGGLGIVRQVSEVIKEFLEESESS